ncbi:hypothetical protein A2982_04315 [candidate division WWE3 bacterium RIFCSPLOWO2_01_FULL_39_13]|uniref:Uncharacterized protein n=1 Tax=candidate division WWE3 bacterium RIFCSPLOWO2_01_FULL_39_13 TaxID=1802624 RepID=A0A1F4V1X8_UNCKA|nr:MAG: hypothetical protein A2982_04315 [candidate division WWE3 bacterium RIFCSPLOWO2_01_FULL_39_13]
MKEFIGKNVNVDFVQETGWRRPTSITFNNNLLKVKKIISRWEEHTQSRPWWLRKHRVWYRILLADGSQCELFWNRGAKGAGKEWFLVKRIK